MQSLKEKIAALDKGEPPEDGAGLLGISLTPEEAKVVLIPVPWDATASYGKGASEGPGALIGASHQLDLFDLDFGKPYRAGITMDVVPTNFPFVAISHLETVNAASATINDWVYRRSRKLLDQGKFVAVVGGDHSSPFGLVKALSETHKDFGVLHIDAHHDLRCAYEGYEHSHASIMYNLLENFPEITQLVAVGIRDFCAEEYEYAKAQPKRISSYYDRHLGQRLLEGETFVKVAKEIVAKLPKHVYVSFDIDGLDPVLCPGTGTPVPGGLTFNQMASLLAELVASGRKLIGFDLCEVAPQEGDHEWNANVGARVLYKLCGALLKSQGFSG